MGNGIQLTFHRHIFIPVCIACILSSLSCASIDGAQRTSPTPLGAQSDQPVEVTFDRFSGKTKIGFAKPLILTDRQNRRIKFALKTTWDSDYKDRIGMAFGILKEEVRVGDGKLYFLIDNRRLQTEVPEQMKDNLDWFFSCVLPLGDLRKIAGGKRSRHESANTKPLLTNWYSSASVNL